MRLNSLSGRFLGLTLIFVLITEVLIFVPAMARFRISYLQTQLDLAQLGALAQLATLPEGTRQALRPWTEEAQSLLAARGALRRLGEG